MGLGVSYNQISSIDVNSVKEITTKIFNKTAEKNTALENFDLTKFNRASQGTDLYGSTVNGTQARDIALINSGIQVRLNQNTINSLKYLNTQASKRTMADVTGNISFSVNEETEKKQQAGNIGTFGRVIGVSNTTLDNNKA